MMLKFSKMHGLGNDFVVIDAINQHIELTTTQIQFIANRRLGVGCDQLLLVEKPHDKDNDFRYRIFNADGSEVAQCGNGARCFARFVRDKGLSQKNTISVETASGVIYPTLQANEHVKVDMGAPQFKPKLIPFSVPKQLDTYELTLADGQTVTISTVSMGNPHAVMLVDDIEQTDVAKIGPQIEQHPLFPERVNAGFMQIISPIQIALRVYERGAGETQACGTGACAAVVIGIQLGLLAEEVQVSLRGGDLTVNWLGHDNSVWMTGSATQVFDGEIAWATLQTI